MPVRIPRRIYADMFGPTTGDRVRLADTELIIEVEKDFTTYGEEVKFGGGKVIRDGMGQSQVDARAGRGRHRHHQRADPRSLGHRRRPTSASSDGRIAAIGKAGNPDIQPGVNIVIGPGTEVIAGEGKILTAGGFDSHIHFICPQQIDDALMSGITTHARRRHRPGARHARHHLHARPLAHRPHDPGRRRVAGQSRHFRQGQRVAAGRAGGDGAAAAPAR